MKTYLVSTYGGEVTEVKADTWETSGGVLILNKNVEGQDKQETAAVFSQWCNFVVKDDA